MYVEFPFFTKPDEELWRYMDITKFLSIIDKKALYFSRSDLLGDPFEGSIPMSIGQKNFNDILKSQFEEMINRKSTILNEPSTFHDFIRKSCYVCSFHTGSVESAALWSIYSKSKEGVAIKTTFTRLCDCFKDDTTNNVGIGMINYIDYNQQTIPVELSTVSPLLYKRKSFEFEKETRAIIMEPSEIEGGVSDTGEKYFKIQISLKNGFYIPINLDVFIERVYIAPSSPPWIKELIESIMQKYGLQKEVKQSILDQSPII